MSGATAVVESLRSLRLADKTFYSRHLHLIQAIYEEAKRTGRVGLEEEAVQEVEDLRLKGKST
jgi:hypothetical protein